jgi:GNAT superfamily N-acetyltransferase
MSQQMLLEIIGYVASVLVAVSLMMSSILRLRLINLLGAATFTVYGFLIDAYPVAAVNLLIVFINLYYLRRMLRTREYFRTLEMRPDSEYLLAFLGFYRNEIARFFPSFTVPPRESSLVLFVLRDLVPAGLLVGRIEDDTLRVHLDFVIPRYRDLKVGRFLFHERADELISRGVRWVVTDAGSHAHSKYLERIGFVADAAESADRLYRLRLG